MYAQPPAQPPATQPTVTAAPAATQPTPTDANGSATQPAPPTTQPALTEAQAEYFYALNSDAKHRFTAGDIEGARKEAQEMLTLLPKFKGDWNYGNAVHDGNMILGRIAAREGHIDQAKQYLLAAGRTPGSPQLNSFGPNMSLAKDLLEKHQPAVVLEYFKLCRKFWTMGSGQLDLWTKQVNAGTIPDFGANLVY